MAGVDFKKYGSSSFGEMSVHFDNEIRGNANVEHSNSTINKDLTHLNYYIGVKSYSELVDKCDELITKTDAINPPRPRKDRRVAFSLYVSCPPELEGTDQEDIFYQKVFSMYKTYLPGLIGAVVHKDEKHEYYDSKKGKFCISRNHMHVLGACLTNDGRINCKSLLTRAMCKKVNDDIQEFCLNEWGISYQTGEGRKGAKKTVEQLKAESEVALQAKLAKEGLTLISEKKKELKAVETSIVDLTILEQTKQESLQSLQEQLNEVNDELTVKQAEVTALNTKVNQLHSIYQKIKKAFDTLFNKFSQTVSKIDTFLATYRHQNPKKYEEVLTKAEPSIQKGKTAIETLEKHSNLKYVSAKALKESVVEKEVDAAIKNLEDATEELENLEEELEDDLEM